MSSAQPRPEICLKASQHKHPLLVSIADGTQKYATLFVANLRFSWATINLNSTQVSFALNIHSP